MLLQDLLSTVLVSTILSQEFDHLLALNESNDFVNKSKRGGQKKIKNIDKNNKRLNFNIFNLDIFFLSSRLGKSTKL